MSYGMRIMISVIEFLVIAIIKTKLNVGNRITHIMQHCPSLLSNLEHLSSVEVISTVEHNQTCKAYSLTLLKTVLNNKD